MKKWLFIIGCVALFFFGSWFLMRELTKPLPGEKFPDLGRDHVTDIADVRYSSNPPTSGSHFPIWAKSGLYSQVISDGYLIHSLEHGYVVISYNCMEPISQNIKYQISKIKNTNQKSKIEKLFTYSFSLISSVSAHEDDPLTEASDSGRLLMHMNAALGEDGEGFITPTTMPPDESPLPRDFSSDTCRVLVEELKLFLKVAPRVIIVPRPNLESRIALTAWTRRLMLEYVDPLQIKGFITAFHNRGPEKTME